MDEDNIKLINRAFRAYLSTEGAGAVQPSPIHSGTRCLNGLAYVVLRNERATLAAYRVRTDTGALRRLRRWPMQLMGSISEQSTQSAQHPNVDTTSHV